MFCNNCGKKIEDGVSFCPACGNKLQTQETMNIKREEYGGMQKDYYVDSKRNSGNSLRSNQAYKMKWYKFIIYFQLFAGALGAVLSGVVYYFFVKLAPSDIEVSLALNIANICYSAIYIASGIFALFVRHQMVKYKKNAPLLYNVYLLLNGVLPMIVLIPIKLMIPDITFVDYIFKAKNYILADGITLVMACIMVWLNSIYFGKRKGLFVH